ncbi:MAG TPA: transglycosylase SLT domain-containing protein [Myxococcota bacterium]|nr:transglycosylase SLT domain-containing protein [Myxococcota bacterium]
MAAETRIPTRHPARSPILNLAWSMLAMLVALPGHANVPAAGDSLVIAARDAHRKRDAAALASARAQLMTQRHSLAPWADYWDLNLRLARASVPEVEAFYSRWSGSYVEDRLRNDWLLELGKRRDWQAFRRDYPRFRMNDDPQVTCYAITSEHLDGRPVRERALDAWLAQRDADDGCQHMARTLLSAGVFGEREVWRKVSHATETNRSGAARAALGLLGAVPGASAPWWTQPTKTLARPPAGRPADALDALAVARLASTDPALAAGRLEAGLATRLPPEWAAWAWAQVGRQAAVRQLPEAATHYRRAEAAALRSSVALPLSDETLAWQVRAALRGTPTDWRSVRAAIDSMSEQERADAAWVYWGARADLALADPGADGDPQRAQAKRELDSLSVQMSFYGKLAAEDLGQPLRLPARPSALTAAELEAALGTPGLARALQLIALGLRSEGVREWNFTLRGMDDRQLLSAAQLACDRQVWDRCINTSDRTRGEVDVAQRFPTPMRDAVLAQSKRSGVDPAYVYGLIRQESRFIMDARSHAGASGLMQLMPATAKWTARRLGVPYGPRMINDRDTNLRLGTGYLKLLLDDFDGSQALAAAAYNAGPGRPRRWRNGPELEPAMWAETIPFSETRDYVKKVLSNAAYYGAILEGGASVSLRARLGGPIGPRLASTAAPDLELP